MSEANKTQVGGTHYRRSAFQHWDLAAELHLGYFEGQVTKYVTRARFKNGLADLQKAAHFTQKLLELHTTQDHPPYHKYITEHRLDDYVEANTLDPYERTILREVLKWRSRRDLEFALLLINEHAARLYPPQTGNAAGEPGPAYVNQDRGAGS